MHALVRLGRHDQTRAAACELLAHPAPALERSVLAALLALSQLRRQQVADAALLAGYSQGALRGCRPMPDLAVQAMRAEVQQQLVAACPPADLAVRLEAGARLGEAKALALALGPWAPARG